VQTLLATSTSRELTGWQVLMQVEQDEANERQDLIDSGDGHVYRSGLPDADDTDTGDEDGLLTDGETE
jgi:hypothetical protein